METISSCCSTASNCCSIPRDSLTRYWEWDEEANAFSINGVMGPDEYHYHVNNSAFTNLIMRRTIEFTLDAFSRLHQLYPEQVERVAASLGCDSQERAAWRAAAESIRKARRFDDGVLEQFDGYADLPDELVSASVKPPLVSVDVWQRSRLLENFSTKLIKEADIVLLHTIFPNEYSSEQKRRDYDYYRRRTTFESSLAASPYGIVAATLNRAEEAEQYFYLAGRYNLDFQPSHELP